MCPFPMWPSHTPFDERLPYEEIANRPLDKEGKVKGTRMPQEEVLWEAHAGDSMAVYMTIQKPRDTPANLPNLG